MAGYSGYTAPSSAFACMEFPLYNCEKFGLGQRGVQLSNESLNMAAADGIICQVLVGTFVPCR
ncbi:hypothetical protein K443DRAFT_672937 [Laccaria amethystina LaAM-08-1]|uniref:Uncharacterized protein n=1 Tax=Laccaria amethystina LaAM-08-1 TaxID=1095629 RepID=A0A0C9XSY8_9AGAR|nr:hypothetical protein K443DRAFT_672937 [Laccaria amethystina LaAM-08-1]